MKTLIRSSIVLFCYVISLILALPAKADEFNIVVEGRRPISAAMDKISARFGYVITYEDPRYEYPGDLIDATTIVRPKGPPEPKILYPKGGKLELHGLQVPSSKDSAGIGAMLDSVLANEVDNGGKFKLLKTGNTFHVVPTSVRNRAGRWTDQASILDVRITVTPANRTEREMIEEICKEVALINGVKVIHADPAIGLFLTETSEFGAYDESARDVLIRTLATTGNQMTWKLDYIPSQRWTGYLLTLYQVNKPKVPSKLATVPQAPDRPKPKGSLTPMGLVDR